MKPPRPDEARLNVAPDLSELSTDPSTNGSPSSWPRLRPRGHRRARIRVLSALALCTVIGWSITRLHAGDDDMQIDAQPSPVTGSLNELADAAHPDVGLHDDGRGEVPGIEVQRFLATKVERLVGAKPVIEPIKASAIRPRTVSLVNLWATWCEACKLELPRLRAFFSEYRLIYEWGPAIQFVAVLVDDATTVHAASRGFTAAMPADTVFLVDRNLDGGVKEALGEVGMYPSQLPVTLLLDCNRRVRWHRVGALEEADLRAIGEQIEALRQDEACRKPRSGESRAPVPEPVPPLLRDKSPARPPPETRSAARPEPGPAPCDLNHSGRCGDGCRNRGEDCESCPQDVQCGRNEECMPRGDQAPACVLGSIGGEL